VKLKVRLKNRGHIDGIMRDGGEIVIIDEKLFTDTWMERIAVIESKPEKSLLKRIFGIA